MGDKADSLGRTLDADLGSLDDDNRQLDLIGMAFDTFSQSVRTISTDLGMTGSSADAAGAKLQELSSYLVTIADTFATASTVADRARSAIATARDQYRELPDGELSFWEKAGIVSLSTVVLPGIGTVTGAVAAEHISNSRESEREAAARKALAALETELEAATRALPTPPRVGSERPSDSLPPIPEDTPENGPGTGGYSGPRGGSGGGGGGGSVPTIGTGGPTVGLAPVLGPPSTGITPIVPGTPVPPIGTVAPPPTFQPPGGDTTSDGPTTGVLPGGPTVPGVPGLGSGGGTGGGSIGGGGIGVGGSAGLGGGMAGGLLVGGAALGGAGLSRLAAAGGTVAGPAAVGSVLGMGPGGAAAGASGSLGTSRASTLGGAALSGTPGTTSAGARSGLTGTSTSSSLVAGGPAGAGTGAAGGAQGAGSRGMLPGGGSGAGRSEQSRRRRAGGPLAPNIAVGDDDAPRLGAGARAGTRDAVVVPVRDDADDETW